MDEWTRLTFGNDPLVVNTVSELQLASWHVYEDYTGPLGAGTLTKIKGNHYDPGPDTSERNGWGQWHRADQKGIGMDRTIATGTGFIGQYPPEVQTLYESLSSCPDELLLFFHHVPYTYVLQSGKTVVQHVYDSHFEGAEHARGFMDSGRLCRGMSTTNDIAIFWLAFNIKPSRPRFGATQSAAGFSGSQEFPTRKACWPTHILS